jgi:hypothetical protein
MDERKHLVFTGPGAVLDSIVTQRPGRAAAALIQRRNETRSSSYFLQLLIEIAHLELLGNGLSSTIGSLNRNMGGHSST